MACEKRRYESVDAVRRSHARAGFRLRAYRCEDCGGYHATSVDKRHTFHVAPSLSHGRYRGAPRGLAPIRTLEECEAIAAQMRAMA